MYVEQLYTNCLAHAAYYIESNGEAAIIDPLRETEPYLELAEQRGAKIKYVFETHFHADFVSGHIDLARKADAQIIYGPGANAEYEITVAHEDEEYSLGDVTIQVLHTPGHTLESSCYLLKDEAGKAHAVFTGDTLFVGEVGRPDLAVKSDLNQDDLASLLYDSLNKKIKNLPHDTVVYPGHGPGSACGKNIGEALHSTIGQELQFNYALQDMSRAEFVQKVTEGLDTPPQYFFRDAVMNKQGYRPIDTVMNENHKPLSLEAFRAALERGTVVIDTRPNEDFENGFIPGAINLSLNGSFAVWVGTVLDMDKAYVIVAEHGREAESVLRLARVGYENVLGFLDGGMETWTQAGLEVETIRGVQFEEIQEQIPSLNILDVRNPGEYESGHLPNAMNVPLGQLPDNITRLDKDRTYYLHCAGGYRSMTACSLLRQAGFQHVVNIFGGLNRIVELGGKLVTPEPQTA